MTAFDKYYFEIFDREDPDYDKVIAKYRSEKMSGNWSEDMRIVPVSFNA
jgi:hypothetical protein